jgi:hypothetical protein
MHAHAESRFVVWFLPVAGQACIDWACTCGAPCALTHSPSGECCQLEQLPSLAGSCWSQTGGPGRHTSPAVRRKIRLEIIRRLTPPRTSHLAPRSSCPSSRLSPLTSRLAPRASRIAPRASPHSTSLHLTSRISHLSHLSPLVPGKVSSLPLQRAASPHLRLP